MKGQSRIVWLTDFRGEGFISLMKAFNKAISGLSTTDTETYGQVVVGEPASGLDVTDMVRLIAENITVAIVVIFLLFLFLYVMLAGLGRLGANSRSFGRFSRGEAKSQHRAMSWELFL
jgi:hypothetical protein